MGDSEFRIGLKIAVFAGVWFACPYIGFALAAYLEPKRDVEWALASSVFMLAGVIVGPIPGFLAMRLLFRS